MRRRPFGEQRELFEGGTAIVRIPWDGRSPRALTSGYARFTFRAQAVKNTSGDIDSDQYDLFEARVEGPPPDLWEGAPTLLPLPWEV